MLQSTLQGRAEPLRLACILGNIKFEDDRFEGKDWPKVKPTTPYGSVPVVEIDGKVGTQSGATLRYLGKLAGLYPTDAAKAFKVDEVMDTVGDFFECVYRYRGPDKEKLREDRENFLKEDVPRYMGGLEKRLKAMGHTGPFLVGDKVTIADLVLLNVVTTIKCGILDHVPTNVLDSYKKVNQSVNATLRIPAITEWYRKRPIPNVEI